MCDRNDLDRFARLNRRGFGALGLAAFAAACTTTESGGSVSESAVNIATPDGSADALFYTIDGAGARPAVVMWPDIAGIRPASKAMARRLAGDGYAVLLANPYYRDVAGQQFPDFADFFENGGFEKVKPWREHHSPEGAMRDAKALVGWLDAQDAVDSARGVGTNGYCMTGSWTVYAANALPGRVRAAASMHGGGLVTDEPTSPHRMLVPTASYLFAIGQNDDAKAPGDKQALRAAADAAGVRAEIEVYAAAHGWTVPDSAVYDKAEAERAWGRMLALFAQAL